MIPSQRLLLRRLRQYRRPLLALLLFLFLVDALFLLHDRPRTQRTTAAGDPSHHNRGSGGGGNTSVFIVSVHRNTGKILPAWGAAALALVDYLGGGGEGGSNRVYFSALESGSQDDTKEKLAVLQAQLDARGVPNTVTLGMTVWEQLQEMWDRPDPAGPRPEGWIWNQEDKLYDLRRITYLARERNRALEPMRELERQGIKFDKLLWINDVVFNVGIAFFPPPYPLTLSFFSLIPSCLDEYTLFLTQYSLLMTRLRISSRS